jgi:hypothetical protein
MSYEIPTETQKNVIFKDKDRENKITFINVTKNTE